MLRTVLLLIVACAAAWCEDWVTIHYADGDGSRPFLYNKERKLLFSPSVLKGKHTITIRRADKPNGSTFEIDRPASAKGTYAFAPIVDSMKRTEPGSKRGVCSLVLQDAAAAGDITYAAEWLNLAGTTTKADVDAVIAEMGATLGRYYGSNGDWLVGQ